MERRVLVGRAIADGGFWRVSGAGYGGQRVLADERDGLNGPRTRFATLN